MPNRILRDWTDSENVHKLSAEAERFFTRLIMKSDDYGRYVSDTKLLRAFLFPLYEKLKEEKVASWLKECEDAQLIFCYEVNGKKYLEIKMFDQKLKVRRSKYPPSNEEDRIELQEGYVYIIGTTYEKPVKIGFSVNPWSRLKEISANHPENIEILLTIKGEKRLESLIQKSLKNVRTKNEWFQLNSEEVDTLIDYSKGKITRDDLLESLRRFSYILRSGTETEEKPKQETEVETETKGKVRDNVALTLDEILKLKTEFGNEAYEWMISKLNSFKGSKGKKYKSDYLAILNWVVDAYKEQKEKNSVKKESKVENAIKTSEDVKRAIAAKYSGQ